MNTDGPTEIRISDRVLLVLPPGYERVPLPGLRRWVEALRSGKYKQGEGYLNSGGGYCCLGVLCEVQNRPKLLINEKLGRYSYDYDDVGLDDDNPLAELLGDYGYFPSSVTGKFSAEEDEAGEIATSLSDLNDDGIPFETISDVLELLWCEPEVANG